VNVLTVCPFCGCGCGLVLEVEHNRVHAVSPQRSHPISRGTLCIKGWNSHQFVHHPQRLLHPLIKQHGVFKQASWSQAIDFAVQGLQRVMEQQGPRAVAVVGSLKCTNEEHYLLNKFSRTVIQTPHVDTAMRLYHSPTVRGLLAYGGYGAGTVTLADLAQAQAILVIGAHPKTQSPNVGSHILQAVKRGCRVLVIDPHEQDHSAFYTLQLQPKPQTDLVILNALLHTILEKGWQRPLTPVTVDWQNKLSSYTAEQAASISGCTAKDIVKLAELFATAGSGVVIYGNGLTQQADAMANIHAVWNLALLTGNLHQDGGGILPLMNTNNMQGSIDVGLATELLPGHALLTDAAAADHFASFWHRSLPEEPGYTLPEMVREAGASIKAMYVVGENLARSLPCDSALDKLDFLMVQELFLTETAQHAQVVFPACSFAEKEGTVTNMERRVQRIQRAIAPLGESKPDGEILSLLAEKLGVTLNQPNVQQIFSELSKAVPMYAGLDYEALRSPGGAVWPRASSAMAYAYAPIDAPKPIGESAEVDYPLTLIIGRGSLHRMTGTLIDRSFTLAKEESAGMVEVNTEDAKAMKLRSGWNVRVKTRFGELVCQVVVTRAVAPGVVYLPLPQKGNAALCLASPALETMCKIPQSKACAARLEMM